MSENSDTPGLDQSDPNLHPAEVAAARKKPTFGAGAEFWKDIDTDEWDKLDEEIEAMFKDSIQNKELPF